MSDSFGRISSTAPTANNTARGGQLAQVITLPDTLNNTAKAIRLEGQITQLTKNGTALIETPKGNVEVKIKGNKQPQKGQRIEIELPAGRPPRQATIRNAPPQNTHTREGRSYSTAPSLPTPPTTVITDPRITTPVPPQTQTVTTNGRPATQPLPPTLQETVSQPASTNAQARPLTTETVVRLLSVPPAQAQTIATEYAQTLPQPQLNTLTRTAFTANITAQNTQNQLTQSLLQAVKNTTISAPKTQSSSILQTPVTPQTLLTPPNNNSPATIFLTPQSSTQVLSANQTLSANNAVEILQTTPAQQTTIISTPTAPQSATLTSLPINFDPSNPASLVTSRFQKIDIQIIKITPPITNIAPLTSNTAQTQGTALPPAAIQFTPPLTSINTATTITAQVTGFTQNGLPLVTAQWPGSPLPQSFILQFNSNNLQLGSQLQITPKTSAAPITPLSTPQSSTMNSLLQGFQWPALDELYNSLLQVSPQTAASLTRSLPNAGNPSQIGAAAMMFIAAIKSGDLGSFLGDKKIDLIQKAGHSDILGKLTQNNPNRSIAPEPTSSGDWKAVPLPMFWEGEIHKITLFTRSENQGSRQDNEGNTQTRFVFDLSLSRMGDVQLDGLLRDKRLDLVVRTQNKFSEPMQQTIRQAYSTALNHTELSGDLNFQGSTKNWVHVLEQKEQLGVHV